MAKHFSHDKHEYVIAGLSPAMAKSTQKLLFFVIQNY